MYPSDHLRVHDAHPGQGKIKFFYGYFFDSGAHRSDYFLPVNVDGKNALCNRVRIYIMEGFKAKNFAYPDKICIFTMNASVFTLFFVTSIGISL